MTRLDPSDFESLKKHVVSVFPPLLAPLCASAEQQRDEIKSLNRTIGSERFFFVVDLTTFDITASSGVQRWLGYYEKDFTLKKYWRLVHPGMQKPVHTVFLQLCDLLCTGKFELEFMVQRYSSLIALKHANGNYVLAKRTASVFQYDKQNRLTEYLNEFTVIGPYNGEPLAPFFFTDKGEAEQVRGQIVMQKTIEQFLGMKVFSVNELHVARLIAYRPGITQAEIAAELDKSVHTIDTYYKRFLKKIPRFLLQRFFYRQRRRGLPAQQRAFVRFTFICNVVKDRLFLGRVAGVLTLANTASCVPLNELIDSRVWLQKSPLRRHRF